MIHNCHGKEFGIYSVGAGIFDWGPQTDTQKLSTDIQVLIYAHFYVQKALLFTSYSQMGSYPMLWSIGVT